MTKTQKNEGFYARLVKITNTFVQKPLIFALKICKCVDLYLKENALRFFENKAADSMSPNVIS